MITARLAGANNAPASLTDFERMARASSLATTMTEYAKDGHRQQNKRPEANIGCGEKARTCKEGQRKHEATQLQHHADEHDGGHRAHLPASSSQRRAGAQSKASMEPRSRSPAVMSMAGWMPLVTTQTVMMRGMNEESNQP